MTSRSHIHRTFAQAPANKGFFHWVADAHAAWRQRRALARLDDAALKDIGVSATDAAREARRPIWDVPAHWRR